MKKLTDDQIINELRQYSTEYAVPPVPYLEWTAKLSNAEIKVMTKHGWKKKAKYGKIVTLVYEGKP